MSKKNFARRGMWDADRKMEGEIEELAEQEMKLSARPINDPTSSHGSVKFDLVSVEIVEKSERNIGDKTYLYGDGWLAPPRTWICGLNYKF